jgi:hypothetical protein
MLEVVAKLYYACSKNKEGFYCQSVTTHGLARFISSSLQITINTHHILVLYFDEGLIKIWKTHN